MPDLKCYCCSEKKFADCCEPFLQKKKFPSTAEELMRSRYTAYALHDADYLIETTAKATRQFHKRSDILSWAKSNQWVKLEIHFAAEAIVSFSAYYLDSKMKLQIHYEKSQFVKENDRWKYLNFA